MLRAGSSTGEIARALGVTEGAVRNLKVALRLRGVAS
jgi:DNA-binding CsgD family transcriptional regulator